MKERIKSLEEAGYDGIVVLDVPIPVREGFWILQIPCGWWCALMRKESDGS